MLLRSLPLMALLALFDSGPPAGAQAPGPTQQRPYLGIMAEPPSAGANQPGVVVREVAPGSPAAQAGLREGDEIVKVDKRDVKDFADLVNVIARHRPGEKLDFRVVRGGKEQDVTVTLAQQRLPRVGPPSTNRPSAFLGVGTEPLTPTVKTRLGVSTNEGAVVMEVVPGTPAEKAGLRRDDVITALDGKPVTGPQQLREAVAEAGAGKEVTLSVNRGNESRKVKVKLEESPPDTVQPPGPGELSVNPLQRIEQRLDRLERQVRELEQKQGSRPPG